MGLPLHAWDLHVHAAPSLFHRWGDAWDVADAAHRARMGGLVLKSHHGSTVETAALLSRRYKSPRILGGLVLNHFVGGLNPFAVDGALRLGAKMIWLPTIHARNHHRRMGRLGGYKFQRAKTKLRPRTGISILDRKGGLVAPVREILRLMNKGAAALGTGHLSGWEIAALQRYIRRERYKIRLLINHVFLAAPGLSVLALKSLQNTQTWFETAYITVSPLVRTSRMRDIAGGILSLPKAQWVLASDSGQKGNPPAPKALELLARGLERNGVSKSGIRKMLVESPKDLLGI